MTRLHLIETNCLPVLTHASPALSLSQENIRELMLHGIVYRGKSSVLINGTL